MKPVVFDRKDVKTPGVNREFSIFTQGPLPLLMGKLTSSNERVLDLSSSHVNDIAQRCFSFIRVHNQFCNDFLPGFKPEKPDVMLQGAKSEKGVLWENIGWDTIAFMQAEGVGKGTKVLDLGSGKGELDIAISSILKADVTGVEWEKDYVKMADSAKSWFATKGLVKPERLRFIQGDFTKQDISGYDVVHYFQLGCDEPQGVEELVLNGLKKGARFTVYHYDSEGAYPFDRLKSKFQWERIKLRIENPHHHTTISPGAIFTNKG